MPGLVNAFYSKLEADHGAALVASVFGLLVMAKEGLSERNLIVSSRPAASWIILRIESSLPPNSTD